MAIVPGNGSSGCDDGEQIESMSSSQTACRNEPTRCGDGEQSSGCDNGEQVIAQEIVHEYCGQGW
jgi:hypothetical protein